MGLFHAYVVGQIDEFPQVHAFLDGNVVNPAGPGVLEVAVIDEVGTKAGGTAFKVDLIDKAMVYQSLQAVVNRRQGDAGEFFADPVVDFIGCGVVALFQKDLLYFLPLLGESQAGNDWKGRSRFYGV